MVDKSIYEKVQGLVMEWCGDPVAYRGVHRAIWDSGFCETCSYPEDGLGLEYLHRSGEWVSAIIPAYSLTPGEWICIPEYPSPALDWSKKD